MSSSIFEDEKKQPGMGSLSIIVVVIAAILLFGLVLTSITGIVSSSASYEELRIATPAPMRLERIHDFTWPLYLVFLGSIYFFYCISRRFVSRRINDFALMLSLMGAVLLLVSVLALFLLTPAVQHIEDPAYPLNLRIGWLVEFFTFGLVGLALGFAGNKMNKGKTPLVGTIGFLITPALIVSSLLLFGIGLHDAIYYEAPTSLIPLTPIQLLGWIVTALVFLALSAVGVLYLKKTAGFSALAPNVLPLKVMGAVYLIVALVAFILGMQFVVFAENFSLESIFKWLADSLSFGALGAIAFIVAMGIQKKQH